MIRIAAMMIAGTAKLASSLVAWGGYPKPSISRRRSRSGRSSIMIVSLGRPSLRQERRNRREGPDGTRARDAKRGRAAKPRDRRGPPGDCRKGGGDGVKIARYKPAR